MLIFRDRGSIKNKELDRLAASGNSKLRNTKDNKKTHHTTIIDYINGDDAEERLDAILDHLSGDSREDLHELGYNHKLRDIMPVPSKKKRLAVQKEIFVDFPLNIKHHLNCIPDEKCVLE